MKLSSLLLAVFVLLFTACSTDADKFEGVWQSVNDPSKQIIFSKSGKTFTFETRNLKTSLEGTPGTYNDVDHALEFVDESGETIQLVYNVSADHILGLGEEFVKSGQAAAEREADEDTGDEQEPDEDTGNADEDADSAPAQTSDVSSNSSNCDKGEMLIITGNNVRVRNEPDITKQNILMQVHKNFEVVRLDDRTVDGQKWYKICYDGNIGWVSGQYASKK